MSLNKTIIALAFALALTACSKQEEATDAAADATAEAAAATDAAAADAAAADAAVADAAAAPAGAGVRGGDVGGNEWLRGGETEEGTAVAGLERGDGLV